MSAVNTEEAPEYITNHAVSFTDKETAIIDEAKAILDSKVRTSEVLSNPGAVRMYLRTCTAGLEHEVFGVLFLDNRHRVIANKSLFRGTIDGAAVPPREVVKEALHVNAAAVILYHNHPSGVAEPSRSDRNITERLKDALGLIEIRVLDHFVVGDGEVVSFAERGWV